MDEEKVASALFGNPGGSAGDHGQLDSGLAPAFDRIEHGARDNGDADYAATITGARKALVESLQELGAGPGVAKELSEMIADYHGKPRDEETIQKNFDAALEALSEEWGSDNFKTTFAGAKKVIAKLLGTNVANLEFFHGTGLVKDVRLLRIAGAIAKSQMKGQTRASGRTLPSDTSTADRLYGDNGRD
jgi:hypothetical protein